MSFALLAKLLMEGTRTCQELAEETGLHVRTVQQYTYAMHKVGVVYIAGYEDDACGRGVVRIFLLGEGKDVKRHKDTGATKAKRYREKRDSLEMMHRMAA